MADIKVSISRVTTVLKMADIKVNISRVTKVLIYMLAKHKWAAAYYTLWIANNKGADHTVQMCRQVCAFVIRMQPSCLLATLLIRNFTQHIHIQLQKLRQDCTYVQSDQNCHYWYNCKLGGKLYFSPPPPPPPLKDS